MKVWPAMARRLARLRLCRDRGHVPGRHGDVGLGPDLILVIGIFAGLHILFYERRRQGLEGRMRPVALSMGTDARLAHAEKAPALHDKTLPVQGSKMQRRALVRIMTEQQRSELQK